HYIGVWVKSAANPADAAELPAGVSFTIASVTGVMLTADRMAPQAPGTTVTWTAAPTGGVAPYQYKWMVYDGSTWTMAAWTTSNTYAWTPAAEGTTYVGVWVKSASNPADAPEVPISKPFTIVTPQVTSVALTPDQAGPQSPGTTITWTATPTGGAAP